MPPAGQALGLGSHHTPLLVFGPGVLREPKRIERPASQCDVMATVAGLAGANCINTTLGRNLLDPRFESKPSYAYVQMQRGTRPVISLVGQDHIANIELDGTATLHALDGATLGDPARLAEMRALGLGLYRTTKWLLYHNGRGRYEEQR